MSYYLPTRLQNLLDKARLQEKHTMTNEEKFPIEDWQYEVRCGDTMLGYVDWVMHNLDAWSTWQRALSDALYAAARTGDDVAAVQLSMRLEDLE